MIWPTAHRCAALVTPLTLLLTGVCATPIAASAQRALPAPTAWRFTWTIASTADGKAVNAGAMVLDVAVWKGTVRITVREGPLRAVTGEDGTILLRAADSTLAVIKPARREALSAAASDLGAMLGGPGAGFPLEVSDASSTTRVLGGGARAFGHATRRVELTQRYTIEISTPTVRRSLRTKQVHDIEISREIGRLDPGFRVFAEQFARALGLPHAVRTRLRALERSMPEGMPVRTTTTAVTVADTDTLRTTMRAEMALLRQERVDTTTFVIPAGFRVTDMSRLLQRGRLP